MKNLWFFLFFQLFFISRAFWVLDQKIEARDGDSYFGYALAVSENYLIIGARVEDFYGAVHVYHKNASGWFEKVKLVGPTEGSWFGTSVSLEGDTLVVGAEYATDGISGNVFIFTNNGTDWNEEQRIVTSSSQRFGNSVSLFGNYLAIGAPADGSVYIFHKESAIWVQFQKIFPQSSEFLGLVYISANYLFLPFISQNQGIVDVYEKNGNEWVFLQRLISSDSTLGDQFGDAISSQGNYLVIGAPRKYINGNEDQGKAYIFKNNGTHWNEEQSFLGDDSSRDYYGSSVSIWNNYIVVGSPAEYESIKNGRVYIYSFNGTGWNFFEELSVVNQNVRLFGKLLLMKDNSLLIYESSNAGISRINVYSEVFQTTQIQTTADERTTEPIESSSSSFTLIIALSVVLPIALILFCVLVVMINLLQRKKKKEAEEVQKETTVELASTSPLPKLKKNLIPTEDITIESKLGEGNFGEVYKANWEGTTVALKKLKGEDEVAQFEAEAAKLAQLNHPNVIYFKKN